MEPENKTDALEALQRLISEAVQAESAIQLHFIIKDVEEVLEAAKEQLNELISSSINLQQ